MNQEDTTTSTVQEQTQAQDTAQLETTETQAVQGQEGQEVQTQANDAGESEGQSEDAELLEWAQKKNIKTDDPMAMLKMVRASEQKMHEATTSKANELRETVGSISQEHNLGEAEILVNTLRVTDFYLNNPDARSLDDEMANIVREKPYLAGDLDTVYRLAKFNTAESRLAEERKLAKKEALAAAAKAETAAPPEGNATTRQAPAGVSDEDIAKMSASEYQQWKKETGFNPFKAS